MTPKWGQFRSFPLAALANVGSLHDRTVSWTGSFWDPGRTCGVHLGGNGWK